MKRILGLGMILFLTGCLVLGAPQRFHFKTQSPNPVDSVILVSFPNEIDYQYWQGNLKLDSIYLVNPFSFNSQKMKSVNRYYQQPSYMSVYDRQRWNLKKVRRMNFVLLKKYQNNAVMIDTFYRVNSKRN